MQGRVQRIGSTTAAAVVIGWHQPAGHHLTIGLPIEIALTPIRHRKRRIDVGIAIVSRTAGVIGDRKLDRRSHLKAAGRDRDLLTWGVVRLVGADGGWLQHIVSMRSNKRLINREEGVGHGLSEHRHIQPTGSSGLWLHFEKNLLWR